MTTGTGKKLWGWYPTGKVWLPIQVDLNGKLIVDMSGVDLGDLGDVNITAPAANSIIKWDAVAGEWIDIPLWVPAHAASHEDTGADEIDVAGLSGLTADEQDPLMDADDWGIFHDFTNFLTAVTVGGVVTAGVRVCSMTTTAVNNSTATVYVMWPFPVQLFNKDITICFSFYPNVWGTGSFVWFSFGKYVSAADPTDKCIGFRLDDLALKGITHDGANIHVIDLATLLVSAGEYALKMVYTAGVGVEWFVDGVSKGSSADIPNGAVANSAMYFTCKNAAAGFSMVLVTSARWAYKGEW